MTFSVFMYSYTILLLIASSQLLSNSSRMAMISFDEGPSDNINALLDLSSYYQIPLVFHLDPFHEDFNKEYIVNIIERNNEVGMAITEEISENEDEIKDVINKFTNEFIKKSGFRPKLVRLPNAGIISEKALDICYDMDLIPTIPNLDSEDDQKANIWPFIISYFNSIYDEDLIVVFRDAYQKSVELLVNFRNLLISNNFSVVPAYEFLNVNTNLVVVDYKTEYEIIKDNTIKIVTKDGENKIKEMTVPYSNTNKLIVREALKDQENVEVEEVYHKIMQQINELEDQKDSEEGGLQEEGILQENNAMLNLSLCSFIMGLILFL